MSEPAKAVFLSYASQDAEAARRICETLRGAGIEVWFDAEGGLEHGDEWDTKIRRQVKECVLFLPLISANTQAREEGYFRIEWDLAAERARGIASGVAFILPVVIDGTREPDALVPDRFRAVQWTRLPGGVVPPDVLQRFLKLWSHRTGVLKQQARATSSSAAHDVPPGPSPARRPRWTMGAVTAIVVGVTTALWVSNRSHETPKPAAPAKQPEMAPATATAKPARDPALIRAEALIYSFDAIPEDFSLAEDLVKPLAAARPNDPDVITVYAEVLQEGVTRGFNVTLAGRAQAQNMTERAVQLAPDSPAALGALAHYLLFVRSQLSRAEELARRAMALDPTEPRHQRTLYGILFETRSPAELKEFEKQMAAAFPNDVLVNYDIARCYKDAGDLEQAERWFDRVIVLKPLASALVWKAWLRLELHGDVAGMEAALDRVPERQRATTRVVNAFALRAQTTGRTEVAERLLNAVGDDWLSDFDFTGPKALLLGDLARADGRADLAAVQYQAALDAIRQKEAAEPTNLRTRRAELWALLWLGRKDEARAALRLAIQSLPSPYHYSINYSWWSGPARAALLLGERATALSILREACTETAGRLLVRNNFKVDPLMAPFRDDTGINAILNGPAEGPGAAETNPADAKSVAVLAFANLSDDKGNEYFSDGISEELLNVLAKVSGLKVSARTSAFYFKGKEVPIPEIARQLGVAYVVEGSVRKSGNKVRITAQLIKAADGFHVWSDNFDRDLKDIFAVQDEIAALIAKNLELKMGVTSPESRREVNPEAHQEVLEGWHYLALRTSAGFDQAEKSFAAALKLDPQFALAHAGLANVSALRGRYRLLSGVGRSNEFAAETLREGRLALQLDPSLAEAHAAMGSALTDNRQFDEAEAEFQQAFAVNPSYGVAYHWYCHVVAGRGRLDLALQQTERSVALDPYSFIAHFMRVAYSTDARRFAAALADANLAATLRGDVFLPLEAERIRCLAGLGRRDEAVSAARRVLKDPNLLVTGWWCVGDALYALRQGGVEAEAAAAGDLLLAKIPEDSYVRGYVLCALGRYDTGIPALENAPAILQGRLPWIPMFDPVRDTPAYGLLVKRLKCAQEDKVGRDTLARMLREQEARQ